MEEVEGARGRQMAQEGDAVDEKKRGRWQGGGGWCRKGWRAMEGGQQGHGVGARR